MLLKGAVLQVETLEDQFLSSIFLVPKRTGGRRPITNVKSLNKSIHAPYFKMGHLQSFLPFVRQGMYITSLDLLDAYFSLPTAEECRKFFHFM